MAPLAYELRPKEFSDIVGQSHLIGKNGIITKMIENDTLSSFVLYGPPGVGKTTIASIIMKKYNGLYFNASTDSKSKLKDFIDSPSLFKQVIVIDEIHRMKIDTQDYLLPFIENGTIIIIGLTTENPYHAVNPAIRSRLRIYRLYELSNDDLLNLTNKIINKYNLKITDEAIKFVVDASNNDARCLINMLEILINLNTLITIDICKTYLGDPNLKLDMKKDYFYDLLSALQKSIRGSDVNAAILYLAHLLTSGDLEAVCRRLLVIAYEDVGLANPNIGVKAYCATQSALRLGLPEARIPLATLVCDMALAPKSNSAEMAINKAMENLTHIDIPNNIKNREIKLGSPYLYPHDYPSGFVKQQYMPDSMIGVEFYNPKETGQYEKALKEIYEKIKKLNSSN